MLVTDGGISRLANNSQYLKALSPMLVTDGDIVTCFNKLQFSNVPSPISVTDDGITTVVTSSLLNALPVVEATPVGNVYVVMF
jgi:hypothetical protein